MRRAPKRFITLYVSLMLASGLLHERALAVEEGQVFPPGQEGRILAAFAPLKPGDELTPGCVFDGLTVGKQLIEVRLSSASEQPALLSIRVGVDQVSSNGQPFDVERSFAAAPDCRAALEELEGRFRSRADGAFWAEVLTRPPSASLHSGHRGVTGSGDTDALWWLALVLIPILGVAWRRVLQQSTTQPSGVADHTNE